MCVCVCVYVYVCVCPSPRSFYSVACEKPFPLRSHLLLLLLLSPPSPLSFSFRRCRSKGLTALRAAWPWRPPLSCHTPSSASVAMHCLTGRLTSENFSYRLVALRFFFVLQRHSYNVLIKRTIDNIVIFSTAQRKQETQLLSSTSVRCLHTRRKNVKFFGLWCVCFPSLLLSPSAAAFLSPPALHRQHARGRSAHPPRGRP